MNELKRIAEFRSVLSDYKLSPSAQQVLADARVVLLVGPSGGGGRNTIIGKLLETGQYHYIVSDTTRQIRQKDGVPIEKNGREYWFRNEDEVLEELRKGEFLEAAIIHEQQVSGVSIREVAAARNEQRIAITDVETAGADTIHRLKPDAVVIFVIPPSFESWMQRLRGRSDLPEDEVRRRLESACQEFETVLARDFYIVIVNDNLEAAVNKINAVATGSPLPESENQSNLTLVRQLLADAHAYLATKSSQGL